MLCSREGSEHTKALSALSHLTCLKLSSNGFSTTPLGLSTLTALKRFHFAANLLESADSLSCVLGSLTGLTKLILQQCSLKAVPDGLAALPDLQWLCLSRNYVQAVPKNMPWRNLQVLHLRGNELSLVPCAALQQARQLVHLDCGDNFPLQVTFLSAT